MIIEEMHIGIDMDLQKVNTYTQKNLLPQEKDFFLNGEVLKFIKQRTNPLSNLKRQGTDKTIKRYEDLSDLTETIELEVQVDEVNNTGVCILPDDYYAYISSKSNVYQLCETDNLTLEEKTLYVCEFPLSFPTSTVLTTYTVTLNTDAGDTKIYDIADLPTGYIQNVDINKQRFMLLKSMKILIPESLDDLSADTYSLYWERYSDTFYNNSFIIVSSTPFNSVTVDVNSTPVVYNSVQSTYEIYGETSSLWARNRLIEDEFTQDTQQSHLSKSRPDSPVIGLKQNVLKVEFPLTSICQKVKLVYVSKPTILDLMLQRNLNMKDTVAKEIVSNTVRFLKGVFKGDYQTYLNENVMIE